MSHRAYYAVNKGHRREAINFVNQGHAVPIIKPEPLSTSSLLYEERKLEPVKRSPTEKPKTTTINSTYELLGKKRLHEEVEGEIISDDDGHKSKHPAKTLEEITIVYTDGASSSNGQAAVIHALQQDIQGTNTLEIRTDSMYVIKAVTEWCKNWVKNNWKSSTGKEVQNRDLLEQIIKLVEKRKGKVKFVHVRGHQGIEGNEMADKLAVAGAQKSL
ncbi:ribonuclease H-like domain-containing protein [Mycotypha africana]|uniref:ribonuclease H-like domain-containing protein n=1 Tax=Mycotypha africana TaxID=64632 RepID=UPI00230181E6|nr:ribonuclease H-like domain-containing protein [Mycotypha africana]KAI8971999.1 ribonuclease H-like domain-containing protein [Mycotypha africana]